jgi:hypothetical protein
MTLKDIKQKATASELTLIERVEFLLRDEANASAFKTLLEFVQKNPPPNREDMRFSDANPWGDWNARLTKHLNLEKQ